MIRLGLFLCFFFACSSIIYSDKQRDKKINKIKKKSSSFETALARYIKEQKCKPVTNNEYHPYILKSLFEDWENPDSAILYCRKGNSLGILIYLGDKFKNIPMSKCPRYIKDVPQSEVMGLDYDTNKKITSGLEGTVVVYSCHNRKWRYIYAH